MGGDATLAGLGWDDRLAGLHAALAADLAPARVLAEERGRYLLATATGEIGGVPSGRLRHAAELDASVDWPAVGDWTAVERPLGDGDALVHAVLPRRSAVVRHAPGDRGTVTQTLAANVDTLFIVTSLNADLNLRRLERYLAVGWDSGATPVVLLSKADLAADPATARDAVLAVAAAVDVIAVSAVSGEGLDDIRRHLAPGRTVVFVGSSGVGKSTLVNALAGAPLLATGAIREDDARGRHTTTRRQLVRLADGLVIDTPGLRELGVLDEDAVSTTFADVLELAAGCRFGDCAHDSEPGCAIREAIRSGRLARVRLDAYRKLQREARRAAREGDALARRADRRRWTAISKSVSRHMTMKYGAER